MSIRINAKSNSRGLSLIELVVSIVVLAVAAVGIFSALGSLVGRSADPLIREQSIAIAEAYLEEITLAEFSTLAACPAVPGAGGRANFSHICHYQGLTNTGAVDQNGNAIPGLENYTVNVAIAASSALGGLASSEVLRIDVGVTGPTGETLVLNSYRSNY